MPAADPVRVFTGKRNLLQRVRHSGIALGEATGFGSSQFGFDRGPGGFDWLGTLKVALIPGAIKPGDRGSG
jgi:hypothetical protein